jgi:UDP-N-acetylglucosamine diphosphorylase / glucose-1-phosphate thymidylyltransferase / UDP-N-acetylgalactosamine diphosphorylase / glucosamine-1-phosphate N-acetyltransferase / galactosamine-1-phosphate N-acetyltransferase
MKAVVFAAGKGERLWPLTESRPKPLLVLAGQSFLERSLRGLLKAGIREILLVVSHKEKMVRDFLKAEDQLRGNISIIHQALPRGTADALKSCEGELQKERQFIVTYGDDYYSQEGIRRFVKSASKTGAIMMAAGTVEDSSKFGKLEIKNRQVVSIHEKLPHGGPAKVNAGLYSLDESIWEPLHKTGLSGRGEYELTDSMKNLIAIGKQVRAFPVNREEWLGITYPWDLLEANRMLLQQCQTTVRGKVEARVEIKGRVRIGERCVIKSGTYIEGPVIIDDGSTVGPNSYLRQFTSIGKNCKVGASCEIKNSILMDNVKVPHLSYVGDSIVGDSSSLGAGTITANLRFDDGNVKSEVKGTWIDSGRRKLGAVFGDAVRTGINVSIFPGVKVGPGAWVGPGVLLRKDVPSGGRVRR